MSYCLYSKDSGGAGCGYNNSQFHPTTQGLIESRIAAHSPGCIAPYVEEPPADPHLFKNGFE